MKDLSLQCQGPPRDHQLHKQVDSSTHLLTFTVRLLSNGKIRERILSNGTRSEG